MEGTDKRSRILWMAAALIAATGAIVLTIGLFTPAGAASFGWFAYQPLADATFMPDGSAVILSRVTVVGGVIFTLGMLAVAFLAGRTVGRRRAQ